MKTVFISGGSRGLGLEFTKQYLSKGYHVLAASRNALNSTDLEQLKLKYNDQLEIYQLDVSSEESRQRIYQDISKKTEKIDILINNAGIASGNEKFRYKFGELNQEDLCRSFLVNSVAQLMITEKFFPLLKKSAQSIVANISSDSGSISKKKYAGSYGYSSSKTALNMITKILSIELKEFGIIVVSLHPGWVKTTMIYTVKAPLESLESISGMIQVIESLEMKDSGNFFDWNGNEMPW
jgi:NAD(P)-dependent dehydrogenase (short-subunit alcohol dehydrogenase family)